MPYNSYLYCGPAAPGRPILMATSCLFGSAVSLILETLFLFFCNAMIYGVQNDRCISKGAPAPPPPLPPPLPPPSESCIFEE